MILPLHKGHDIPHIWFLLPLTTPLSEYVMYRIALEVGFLFLFSLSFYLLDHFF